MKKILLMLVFLFCLTPALAEECPSDVTEWFESNGWGKPAQHLLVDAPDGARYCFVLTESGWSKFGFKLENGEWTYFTSTGALGVYADAQLVTAEGGYRLQSPQGAWLAYAYRDGEFVVSAWCDPARYQGEVRVEGTLVSYYPNSSTTPECTVDAGSKSELGQWTWDFDHLPATPEEGRNREKLTPKQLGSRFKGYTLMEDGRFVRLEDGIAHVKAAYFNDDATLRKEIDLMPVPVTENGIDFEKLHISGEVLESDLREYGLLMMHRENGEKRVALTVQDERGGYVTHFLSPPLGEDVSLDIYNDEQGICLRIGDDRFADYKRTPDGLWRLNWWQAFYEGEDFYAKLTWGGIKLGDEVLIGDVFYNTLVQFSPDLLPWTEEDLRQAIVSDGWAVVDNPDPKDRLHLRTEPSKKAQSLGKFYNGTPVKVLDSQSGWLKVQIGTLEGWMMSEYLAIGDEMQQVESVFPQKVYLEKYFGSYPAYTSYQLTEAKEMDGPVQIIGVVNDESYILITDTGDIGYAPQSWFFDGNG